MPYMILEYEFKDTAFAELSGPNIKFWSGEGLPLYEGGFEGFEALHPAYFTELLAKKLIKLKT
jgi:hypothetical protein